MHKNVKESKEKVSFIIINVSSLRSLCMLRADLIYNLFSHRGKGHLHMPGLWTRVLTKGHVALQ
jgi:hypothetical protein